MDGIYVFSSKNISISGRFWRNYRGICVRESEAKIEEEFFENYENAIEVFNSTAEIFNCKVYNNGFFDYDATAIKYSDSKIYRCKIFENKRDGIYILESNAFVNVSSYSNVNGITVQYSRVNITGNYFENEKYGIYFLFVNNSRIFNVRATNNLFGIYLVSSSFNEISNVYACENNGFYFSSDSRFNFGSGNYGSVFDEDENYNFHSLPCERKVRSAPTILLIT